MIACIETGVGKTRRIIQAFSTGCEGKIVPAQFYLQNPHKFKGCATFGYLRGSGECVRLAQRLGQDYYYIDHAYLNPCRDYKKLNAKSWYRITKNGNQNNKFKERPDDRWKKYFKKIEVVPWRKGGKQIIVIGLSDNMKNFFDKGNWHLKTLDKLKAQKAHKNFEIVMREKPKGKIDGYAVLDYSQVYAMCGYHSNMMFEGLLQGVPCMANKDSICSLVSNGINLDDLWRGDRMPFLYHATYSQFMLEEMASGFAWKVLNGEI